MHVYSPIDWLKSIDWNQWIEFTFVLISFGESVRKIDEFGSDADILDFEPWSAGKNVEWINAGFGKFKRGATSRVIRKYGS